MGKTRLNPEVAIKKHCSIIGGGEIADYAAVAAEIGKDCFIICADGGFLHCRELGVKPDLLLGDFDSLETLPSGVERHFFPAEKDYTDSTLAVREAAARGFDNVMLCGMLGGRFDHSMANLQNLAWCAQNGINAKITDGATEIYAVKNSRITLSPRDNVYFSVFSLVTECEEVTITGAKYPLNAYSLRFDTPRAVSNEFAGQDAVVNVKNGVIAVIIAPR